MESNYEALRGGGGADQNTLATQNLGGQTQWQPSSLEKDQRTSLNNELKAQQLGAQRQDSFQMNRPAFNGGGQRGGGFRGGGRRR